MLRITPGQVTPAIRALFRTDDMQATRCFVTLDGTTGTGRIIVDDLAHPRWAMVQEAVDNDLFLGGDIDAACFAEVFASLRREGDVLVGLPEGDPRLRYFPPDPAYDGRVLELYDRPVAEGLDALLRQVPADCRIERLDRELVLCTIWGPNDVKFYGGPERWERLCLGYCLVRGDEILSEATVGPGSGGMYEPGVITREDQRGKGYGTMVTARLLQEIEAMGGRTYWNCDKDNVASAAVGRKLGYRREREFRCLAWKKTG